MSAVGICMRLFREEEDEEEEEEEEEEELPKNMRAQRRKLRDKSNVLEMPEQEFVSTFKMSKYCFNQLLEEITPWMKRASRSTSIPPILRLSSFLRFITAGIHQKVVGNEDIASMSQANASKNISECLEIFDSRLCPKWIRLEMSEKEEATIIEKFYSKFGIPGVVGCVGGTHIKLKAPGLLRHLYYNKKGHYSINAMMICDYNMVIRYVDGRTPGANRAADVWKDSLADEYLKSAYDAGKRDNWLLGDSGYPLLPYLMTPYRKLEHCYEVVFNTKLRKAHSVVERCFGILKNRFRCLIPERGLHYSPAMVTKIINTCCALHNICIFYKSTWELTEEAAPETYSNEEEMPSTEAVAVRDELARIVSDLMHVEI